jgi:molybdopterin-guanine dinucleotide biosynthesis protein A
MGTDKAFIEVGGRALATIARDALRDAGAREVMAIGGDGDAFEPLGLRAVADQWPGEGPLGGVVTALAAAAHDVVVVLACDLPAVDALAVTAVLSGLADANADAAVPMVDGVPQVLVAAYRRRCGAPLEDALRAGTRRLRDAVDGLRVAHVALEEPGWVRNVNQPADLERFRSLERDRQGVDALERHADERPDHQ